MAIRVALHHETVYAFDATGAAVTPRGAAAACAALPHADRVLLAAVTPERHFVNWQQDPFGNYVARLVFPEPTRELTITVDLVADMTVINPFDFFVEEYAEHYPFAYSRAAGRRPRALPDARAGQPAARRLARRRPARGMHAGHHDDGFPRRAQPPLRRATSATRPHGARRADPRGDARPRAAARAATRAGCSCRCSATSGSAARFVSGYLVQLAADVKALDGPSGPETRLHRPARLGEVYVPGAGWIGLDPTSGLFAGEGHIPLACTRRPGERGAGHGLGHERRAEVELAFSMSVTRVHEDPRVTQPYTEPQWQADRRARRTGRRASSPAHDVRLTHGRRADLRVDRRHGRRRVEHRRAVADASASSPAQLTAAADAPLRTRRAAALRPGQVVSGRAAAALGARRVLARPTACRSGATSR